MKKIIKKNMRRPFPYFNFLIPVILRRKGSYRIKNYFKFTDSALYNLNSEDQYDVNKLFGFSFGWHHKNSVRFGWRPTNDLKKIEIVGYEYANKVRIPIIPICNIDINKWYKYELNYNRNGLGEIEYCIFDKEKKSCIVHPIYLKKKLYLGYKLHLYFGGNEKAPHDITIYQRKG